MKISILPALLLSLTAAGCTTAAYDAENSSCVLKYNTEIPTYFVEREVTSYRQEIVQTGEMNCTTVYRRNVAHSHCVPVTRIVNVPFQEWVTVDANAKQRNDLIAACAATACTAKFGNAACKG